MSDHSGNPQQPDPRAAGIPRQPQPVEPVPQVTPAPEPPQGSLTSAAPQTEQVLQADHAWVDGYEPGNPWQSRLCVRTPYGTFAYPLTPNTIPELLEQMVLVAQEQQGLPVGFDEDPEQGPAEGRDDAEEMQDAAPGVHGGRAARLTGWAVVHDLWEREDPTARIVMGAVVVALLLLGIFLT
ncbi:hypothetical protein ABT142_14125 [Streptomyces sp. NPDC001857]|uniref:hypothetical protein n=1 Tax=unclassified Streptomyces TaxID=2593676 RepID=UPI0033344960